MDLFVIFASFFINCRFKIIKILWTFCPRLILLSQHILVIFALNFTVIFGFVVNIFVNTIGSHVNIVNPPLEFPWSHASMLIYWVLDTVFVIYLNFVFKMLGFWCFKHFTECLSSHRKGFYNINGVVEEFGLLVAHTGVIIYHWVDALVSFVTHE